MQWGIVLFFLGVISPMIPITPVKVIFSNLKITGGVAGVILILGILGIGC